MESTEEAFVTQAVVCGSFYSFFIDLHQDVWCAGLNRLGSMGLDAKIEDVTTAQKIPLLSNIKHISASLYADHTLFVNEEGELFVAGSNSRGQIGLGRGVKSSELKKLPDLPPIVTTSCGLDHSAFIDHDGVLWTCGNNDLGQLGIKPTPTFDRTTDVYVPVNIPFKQKIAAVSCGDYFTLVLDEKGDVYYTGKSEYLHADCKTFQQIRMAPMKAISTHRDITACLDKKGNVWLLPGAQNRENRILKGVSNVVQITTGYGYLLMLTEQGEVYAYGNNTRGQCGISKPTAWETPQMIPGLPIISGIATGWSHSLFNDRDGNVWTIGSNTFGQLAISSRKPSNIPMLVEGIPPTFGCNIHALNTKSARK